MRHAKPKSPKSTARTGSDELDLSGSYRIEVCLDYVNSEVRGEWRDPDGRLCECLTVTYEHPSVKYSVSRGAIEISTKKIALYGVSISSQVKKFFGIYPLSNLDISLKTIFRPDYPSEPPRVDGPLPCVFGYRLMCMEIRKMGTQLKKLAVNADAPVRTQTSRIPTSAARLFQVPLTNEERQARAEAVARRLAIEQRKEKARIAKIEMDAEFAAMRRREIELKRQITEAPPVPLHYAEPMHSSGPNGRAKFIDLHDWSPLQLLERASLFWVSNQSDDLLCLPQCKIEQLDFQVRSALRVIGVMRGRALLSDEVGLGKTVEAGLVLKEYLTRGMVRRFLILTMPSLVDQWQEELESKFGIQVRTTNEDGWRNDAIGFWAHHAIVASLHTFKQDRNRALAAAQSWDMLIVDEAHHLRNQNSKSWQAVNELPRQFLLLLTATPVQNSLEDLYHLVTLLQPGQLPAPKEFARRFIDRERPRQPREPEELRRLLNQVMIRNTRANAGIDLPPRRAETILFDPPAEDVETITRWEDQLRQSLSTLAGGQASMRGRVILQSAGSSHAAWSAATRDWKPAKDDEAAKVFERLFLRKLEPLPQLAKDAGGLVLFTQFLATQAAVADALEARGVRTWTIHGGTPAAERQPITEKFRREGGVLLLSRSGTEGRNLQFCHRLVNFDLPWNPMEIEQRIGRLHRIGQKHTVEIYNLVTAGTLQARLLDLLQEKLNLFELVVGETGLILGERFASDDLGEEIFRCWQGAEDGDVESAFLRFARDLEAARANYNQIRELDETLFGEDYETG
jgi:superfamily II DNA or RNA helicase